MNINLRESQFFGIVGDWTQVLKNPSCSPQEQTFTRVLIISERYNLYSWEWTRWIVKARARKVTGCWSIRTTAEISGDFVTGGVHHLVSLRCSGVQLPWTYDPVKYGFLVAENVVSVTPTTLTDPRYRRFSMLSSWCISVHAMGSLFFHEPWYTTDSWHRRSTGPPISLHHRPGDPWCH